MYICTKDLQLQVFFAFISKTVRIIIQGQLVSFVLTFSSIVCIFSMLLSIFLVNCKAEFIGKSLISNVHASTRLLGILF